jgi:hypothetical protein
MHPKAGREHIDHRRRVGKTSPAGTYDEHVRGRHVLPASELQFESFLPLVGLAFVLEVEVDDDLGDALSWQ